MNLNDLISKLRTIEEGNEVAPVHTDSPADAEGIEIIGGPMGSMGGMLGGMGHSEPPKQQDSVSMNVSLNGAGAEGVRDLMNILHNIDTGATHSDHDDHDHQEPIMGDMVDAMAHEEQVGEEFDADDGETWANSSHGDNGHHTHGIDSVITTGNDMNSKGGERAKVNGGGNPMQESLVNRLTSMYEEIKGAPIAEGAFKDKDTDRKEKAYAARQTMKHIKNPTKGEKDAAKDIKPGSYKDRADLLKSAENDGRLDESVSQMLALNKVLNG
jgi:hypothetical protein